MNPFYEFKKGKTIVICRGGEISVCQGSGVRIRDSREVFGVIGMFWVMTGMVVIRLQTLIITHEIVISEFYYMSIKLQ